MPDDRNPIAEILNLPPEMTFKGLHLGRTTIAALEDMAYKGLSLNQAADKHKVRTHNLARAFNRPHVRAAYNQIVKSIRENAGQAAYLRNVDLSHSAQSEHVRADLNKWIAGVDGIAAVKKVEGRHMHAHAFAGFDFGNYGDDDDAIDATPTDHASGDDDE